MIFLFNGPPGSGKDAGCSFLLDVCEHRSFKHILFDLTAQYYDVSLDWFMEGYDVREIKERPEDRLKGKSRRQALIHVSEDIIKPKHGASYFGIMLANSMNADTDYCISDSGFVEELTPLINTFGAENLHIIQLFREGCTFSNDSREYMNGKLVADYVHGYVSSVEELLRVQRHRPPLGIRTSRIHNNGSLAELESSIRDIYERESNIGLSRHKATEELLLRKLP